MGDYSTGKWGKMMDFWCFLVIKMGQVISVISESVSL